MPQYKASCWCSGLPGAKSHAHLKHHPSDSQRVGIPGARIFTHLRVGGRGTERVRGRLCDGVSLGNIRNPKRRHHLRNDDRVSSACGSDSEPYGRAEQRGSGVTGHAPQPVLRAAGEHLVQRYGTRESEDGESRGH